ncbi:DsbA family protein [Stenotrophomonas maltophilia]|uniref:DsbA family protein n=1 Tax=Stenotrophomonas maltophilia TaxID=40324 RepID=UPI0040577E54
MDAPAIIAAALSEQNKQALRTQTEQAMARGMFGAPTFFVGEGMFWGDDRLADALANG